jgi:NAD+ kinase
MSPSSFKRIIVYARQHRANQGVNKTLQRLISYLITLDVETYLDIDTAQHFTLCVPILPRKDMKPSDLIVVIGGDGSLLSAARMAIHKKVPVVGINRGHLGFLTDISPTQLHEQLGPIIQGNYIQESRFLLNLRLNDTPTNCILSTALNDIVLNRANETHLITFDVFINDQFVSHYRADGLILATPTGSTAYALSAGGPIMHPELNALVIVPMFSHSLSSRPIVVDATKTVKIKISEHNESAVQVSCDGHESHLIEPGQTVILKKHKEMLRLLHPSDYHYYETLRSKLGWGSASVS